LPIDSRSAPLLFAHLARADLAGIVDVAAVVLDIGLGAQTIGDLLLRSRSHGLVVLELRDARLTRRRDMWLMSVLIVIGHRESFRLAAVTA
jgi:hypothetical protein